MPVIHEERPPAADGSPQGAQTGGGVLLEVAYDGTAFHGWSAQGGTRTVQDTLHSALRAMDPNASAVRGASRTDAGVHAEGQLAAFDSVRNIPARGWVLGLNKHLPDDVAVRAARPVPLGFAPRFAARGKRYRYRLLVDRVRDPRWRTRAWRVPELDFDALAGEAKGALGTHDFASFRASRDERTSTVRTLLRVDIERGADPRVVGVVVEGNAFLYNMVRILVGTMVDVARARLEEGAVARAIAACDRRAAGTTAPSHGLSLERVDVDLPEGTGERWPR
ncbi:MAG: tRNA pseudouridine(38-40) synthase TruA [Myxococcota bacterium]|nr:tRNA pseudouridine(38-40) synthase TruA [Myxococcota bacterium]